MACRAAATCRTLLGSGAAACPAAAPLPAAVAAGNSRPCAGRRLVPSLARPATDFSVTEPDAALTLTPCRQLSATRRAVPTPSDRTRPASGAPFGTGTRTPAPWAWFVLAGRGTFSTGTVGCSAVPVRSVNGVRRHTSRGVR